MRKAGSVYDVIVVGGGAAGMMAAGRAAERGKRVLLLEKNPKLGEKLAITGGGRCNITNAEEDEKRLLAHYGKGEPFLYSAFSQFGVKETFRFFESRGLPLKVEANNRAFPQTERAPDVVQVLRDYLAKGAVKIKMNAPVEKVFSKGGNVMRVIAGGEEYAGDVFIFATGGVSHPETGSTGDGFTWLTELGHTVEKPTPTIVPLKTKEKWVRELSGTTLADAKITFYVNGEKRFSKTGNILLAHFGLTGPTILNSAGKVADLLHEGVVTATIDLHPGVDIGTLDKKILAIFDQNKNKLLKNVAGQFMGAGTAEVFFSLLPNVDPETKTHSVSKESRRAIIDLLKALPVTIAGLMGYDRAVVADGGVVLADVDMRTMRSKKYKNLYIVGDLLHITRPSGGYSLQLCWTTGYIAGEQA